MSNVLAEQADTKTEQEGVINHVYENTRANQQKLCYNQILSLIPTHMPNLSAAILESEDDNVCENMSSQLFVLNGPDNNFEQ